MGTAPTFRNAAANWFSAAQKGAINIHALYTLVAWGRHADPHKNVTELIGGLSRLLPALFPSAASLCNLLDDLCLK